MGTLVMKRVTVEEYIDGEFTKYLKNTGIPCGVNPEI